MADQAQVDYVIWSLMRREQIASLEDFAGKTEGEVLRIRGVGKARLEQIKALLAEHGMSLQQPVPRGYFVPIRRPIAQSSEQG